MVSGTLTVTSAELSDIVGGRAVCMCNTHLNARMHFIDLPSSCRDSILFWSLLIPPSVAAAAIVTDFHNISDNRLTILMDSRTRIGDCFPLGPT